MFEVSNINRCKLEEIVMMCSTNNRYVAGIFVANIKQFKSVVDKLYSMICFLPLFYRTRSMLDNYRSFVLKNGSRIEVMVARTNVRGKRYHSVLVEPNVEHDIIEQCLRPYEITYKPCEMKGRSNKKRRRVYGSFTQIE